MAVLEFVTKATFTLPGSSTSVNVNVPAYVAGRAIVFHSFTTNDNNGEDSVIAIRKTNATTLTVLRDTGGSADIDGILYLAQFVSGVSVEDIETTTPNGSEAITATPVADSFVLGSGINTSGTSLGAQEQCQLKLNSVGSDYTTLSFELGDSPTTFLGIAQVIRWIGADVTEVVKTNETGNWSEAFAPALVAPVMLASSRETVGGGSMTPDEFRTFTSIPGATLTATKTSGTDGINSVVYAVELNDNTVAQHVQDSIGGGSTVGNAAIVAVDLTKTVVMGDTENNNPCMFRTSGSSNYGSFTAQLDTQAATNIRGTRGVGSGTMVWNAGVFEFSDVPETRPPVYIANF